VSGIQQILGGCPTQRGFYAGTSDVSRFHDPIGLALSTDEKTLYVCDSWNNRIRSIDTVNRITHTVAGSGEYMNADGTGVRASICSPRYCDWDRASDIEPFTFLYIASADAIRRLNVKTGEMATVKQTCDRKLAPVGIVCVSGSGMIIVTCGNTRCLWTIDPRTGTTEWLAGSQTEQPLTPSQPDQTEWDPFAVHFTSLYGLALDEHEHSIFVVDLNARTVLRVPLPDRVITSEQSVPLTSNNDK
jgi:sugar lactone lactonase YvrE